MAWYAIEFEDEELDPFTEFIEVLMEKGDEHELVSKNIYILETQMDVNGDKAKGEIP